MKPPLTRKEEKVWHYIAKRVQEGSPCTRRDIAEFLGRTLTPAQDAVKGLARKGYIAYPPKLSKSIEVLKWPTPPNTLLVEGVIAAGGVVVENQEFCDPEYREYRIVSNTFLKGGHYALKVVGDSMIDAGIYDGDHLILQSSPELESLKPKSIVAAYVEGEGSTLKYCHRHGGMVTLIPANPSYQPMTYPEESVSIQGVVVQLERNY